MDFSKGVGYLFSAVVLLLLKERMERIFNELKMKRWSRLSVILLTITFSQLDVYWHHTCELWRHYELHCDCILFFMYLCIYRQRKLGSNIHIDASPLSWEEIRITLKSFELRRILCLKKVPIYQNTFVWSLGLCGLACRKVLKYVSKATSVSLALERLKHSDVCILKWMFWNSYGSTLTSVL